MSHKSEEQYKVVGQCPCGAELIMRPGEDKIEYHKCSLDAGPKFNMVEWAGIIAGIRRRKNDTQI